MPGMRSDAEIMSAFEGMETVPGSSKPRIAKTYHPDTSDYGDWDLKPIIKKISGVDTEVFQISALACALGKSIITVRQWEQRSYIPQSPYRLRNKMLKGQKTAGNRVYTRELIEAAIFQFHKRGLLGKARIEWKEHPDLTVDLTLAWREITNKLK